MLLCRLLDRFQPKAGEGLTSGPAHPTANVVRQKPMRIWTLIEAVTHLNPSSQTMDGPTVATPSRSHHSSLARSCHGKPPFDRERFLFVLLQR